HSGRTRVPRLRGGRRATARPDRGEPEVGHADPAVRADQAVVGLEVAVDDAGGVRGGQPATRRGGDLDGLGDRAQAGGGGGRRRRGGGGGGEAPPGARPRRGGGWGPRRPRRGGGGQSSPWDRPVLLLPRPEAPPRNQLHRDVGRAVGDPDVVDRDHVGVI